jgi:uncharacterized membrane protein YkvA (DUF1232 family)
MWKIIWPVILAILYIVSPYDVLPDFMWGWGWIDDLIVLWFLWRFFKKIKEGSTWSNNQYGPSPSETKGGHSNRQENSSYTGRNEQKATHDPYSILGINPNASIDEIKQAYRHLATQYHPDKVAHLGEEFRVLAESRFKEIQEAYQKLMAQAK